MSIFKVISCFWMKFHNSYFYFIFINHKNVEKYFFLEFIENSLKMFQSSNCCDMIYFLTTIFSNVLGRMKSRRQLMAPVLWPGKCPKPYFKLYWSNLSEADRIWKMSAERKRRDTVTKYLFSANSFRRNYSFLNLTLCTVTVHTGAETIQGRKLFAEIRYIYFLVFTKNNKVETLEVCPL